MGHHERYPPDKYKLNNAGNAYNDATNFETCPLAYTSAHPEVNSLGIK